MSAAVASVLQPSALVILAALAAVPLHAQLVAYEGFGEYAAGVQVESGSNGSAGTGLDGGAGWGSPYDVNNAIKSLVKIEDRTANPVNFTNGGITVSGGNRALRFYDVANGSYALQRPLGTAFDAAAGDTLWFSVLFRTAGSSPLANQDFFQIGFDDNPAAASGSPRVSIGANTTQSTYPAPFRFFARSNAPPSAVSAFHAGVDIAAATTYLLVGCIQAHDGIYDTVSLFVDPSNLDHPGPPSAEVVWPSGLGLLSHLFIRTANLDNGDANVIDEWHVARDYGSVVQSLQSALRVLPPASPDTAMQLRWPVSLAGAVLESSPTLAADSWAEVAGPFSLQGAEWELAVPIEPGALQRFFRLRRD